MDRFLFDLNPNPILIYDTTSLQILESNQAFRDKYEYTKQEIEELDIRDIRPKNKIDELKSALQQLKERGITKTKTVSHQSKSGECFFVNVSSHSYEYENKDARIVFIHDVTERVEAEREAQNAFFELNHHVNKSPLAMIKWDENFQIIEWSKRAYEILGFTKEEVFGQTPEMLEFYSERDRSVVKRNMEAVLSGDRDKAKFDIKLYNKSGDLIDLRIHGSALRDENNDLISVLTFLEDISEQRKTEQKYQRLFENANDGIFMMQGDEFVECNEQVLNIYGCSSRSEILGKTPIDFSPEYQPDGEKSSKKAARKIQNALNGEPQVFEWKHIKKNGTPIDAEVSLNKLELGNKIYVQAIVRDLTEQKKAQEKLKKNEQLFRNLFLQAPSAMVMVDTENKVSKINESFEQLFGYSEEEVLDQNLDEILASDEDAPKMSEEGLQGKRFLTDIKRYTKEGEELDLLLSIIPVHLDGEPIAGFGIYVDISEQKEYERKLKKSVHEKRVLLEEIHHRVKNNLAIVSGLLQMQVMSVDDERLSNYLQNSQLRIQSMSIVHEMLYQSKTLSDIEMESYIEKLVRVIANTLEPGDKDITVNVTSEDFRLNINQAIPCALIVNELVTNSFEFAFENKDSGKIDVMMSKDDNIIRLKVQDDGVGLPENFEEMRKTSLGMSLIDNLTKQLETEIEIESGDWGSAFEFVFEKKDKAGSSSSGKI